MKAEKICCWQTCTMRDIKGNSSSQREMISDRNLVPQEEMKSTSNGKHTN